MSVRSFVIAMVAIGCLAGAPDDASAWQRRVNGTAPGSVDHGFAGAVDGTGDVVAAGRVENIATGEDFAVIKFAGRTGAELWRQMLRGTAPAGFDQALAVAVDWEGNVVAAGSTENTGSGRDFTVVKLAGPDGGELWRYVVSGTAASSDDTAIAVTIDWEGHVVAAGVLENSGTGGDFVVVKLDGATGEELWRYVVNGTDNGPDTAVAVSIDWKGHVVAAGTTANVGTGEDFTVVKIDGGAGTEVWRRVVDGGARSVEGAFRVVVDWSGHVVAGGYLRTVDAFDFTVMRLDGSDGSELWRYVARGTAEGQPNAATTLAVHWNGDVIAGGYTSNIGRSEDLTVVTLDGASGDERWRRIVDGGVNSRDRANQVTVDFEGDVLVAGSVTSPFTGTDIAVLKLCRDTGEECWRRIIDGGATLNDVARTLAVDGEGNVVTVGTVEDPATRTDLAVVKLRGADGGDY